MGQSIRIQLRCRYRHGPGTPIHAGSSGYGTGSLTSTDNTNGTFTLSTGALVFSSSPSISSYTTGTVTTTGTSTAADRATATAQNAPGSAAGGGTVGGGAPYIPYTLPSTTPTASVLPSTPNSAPANVGVLPSMPNSATTLLPSNGMLSEKQRLQDIQSTSRQTGGESTALNLLDAHNALSAA